MRHGVGISGRAGVIRTPDFVVNQENLNRAQKQLLKKKLLDRYCPSCGLHYKAKDVKWRNNTPVCRSCGYSPLKKK